jgi:addiction module RelE/StbE family toxin
MGCAIIFSPQAIADLESAVRFIARNNPDAALRAGDALIIRAAILRDFPELGSKYSKRPGIRKLVSRPYLIFYRYRKNENIVDVLRYWHGSKHEMDLRSLD